MYDNPKTLNYHYAALAVGAGNITRKIKVPRGAKRARVLDIHAFATVIFTQVTTAARAQVGVAGTLDKFADLNIGGLAANAALCMTSTNGPEQDWVAVDDNVTELTVTFVAPTGGSPTGTASFDIAIEWDFISPRNRDSA